MPGARRVLVIGAGAAGLAAAHELARRGWDPLLLDASDRPGGVMRSERQGEWLAETGPNSMLVKAPALELLRSLGLEGSLIAAAPDNRVRRLFHDGRLQTLPTGPWSAVTSGLVSARAKLRILAEPFVRRGDASGETVADFVGRRLGREAVTRLVGPFLTGVYAGDERALGAEAVFPSLVELEREHGSILRGGLARALRGASGPRGLSGIRSCREGLGELARALAEGLGERLLLGTRVHALRRDASGWAVEVRSSAGDRTLEGEAVVIAAGADLAAELLGTLEPDAATALRGIDYAPIVSLSVGVDPADAREPIEGFGLLVPRDAGLRLLGCLFMSRLFPGRAPEGRALLTCMLGGVRWREAVDTPDDRLMETVVADLERTLGLRGDLERLTLARWPRAVPQPGPDHPRRIADVRRRVAALGGVALAGSYLDGVAVSDAMASGITAARSLVARPSTHSG